MTVMDMSASVAAWKNACTIVSAEFLDEDWRSGRFRGNGQHCRREAPHRRIVILIALRPHLDASAAIRCDPVAPQVLGESAEHDVLRVKARADLVELELESAEERVRDSGPACGIGVG